MLLKKIVQITKGKKVLEVKKKTWRKSEEKELNTSMHLTQKL